MPIDDTPIAGPGSSPAELDALAKRELVKRSIEERASKAKTAGDWWDIFMAIVENAAVDTLKANPLNTRENDAAYGRLRDMLARSKRLKLDFNAQGLDLSEEVECEGPVVKPDASGMPHNVEWPTGRWVSFIWPSGEKLSFRGEDAQVALSFFMWWVNFSQQFRQRFGIEEQAEPARRIVEPGSPEWISYMAAKKTDQKAKP